MINKKFILKMVTLAVISLTGSQSFAIDNKTFDSQESKDSGFYVKGFSQGSKMWKSNIEASGNGVTGIYESYNAIATQPSGIPYSADYKKAFGGGLSIGYYNDNFSVDLEGVVSSRQEIKPGEYKGASDETKNVLFSALSKNANYIFAYTEAGEDNIKGSDWEYWKGVSVIYENKGFSYFAGLLNAYFNPIIGDFFKPYVGVGAGMAKLRYDESIQSNNVALQGKVGASVSFGSFEPYIGYKLMKFVPRADINLKNKGFTGNTTNTGDSFTSIEYADTPGLYVKQVYFIHNVEAGLKFLL